MTSSKRDTARAREQRRKRIRIARRDNEPCCRCGRPIDYDTPWNPTKPPPGYPTIDHLDPLALGHPETTTLDRLAPAHWRCNSRHGAQLQAAIRKRARTTARTTAAQQPPRPDLIHQISGPPCAGKSTWIQQHAQPEDTVLDDNQLAEHHGGRDRIPDTAWTTWRLNRARTITTWTGPGHLWYTHGDPTPHSPGVNVTLIDPGPHECHTRADRDQRPPATHTWIDAWYAKHRQEGQEGGIDAIRAQGVADGQTQPASRQRAVPSPANAVTPRSPARFVSKITLFANCREIPETLSKNPRKPGELDGIPSVFPPVHPEAAGSRGDEMVAWAEARRGGPLRWWQWLTAQRRYEVREDGSWCWLLVFTSVARQLGKSVELTEDAAWHGSLGSGALTLHAADRVATSRDVQAELWPWAEESGLGVARQLGDSRIVWPDGSVWKTIAMGSAYSRRPRRLLVDEAWDMDPVQFWNAMFPAMGGQTEPVQALFWSAANAEDRGLVRDLRSDASVCRMEWGALPGEDHGDPAVWRASSAFWTPSREAQMRAAQGRPGFAENWLNVWPAESGGAEAAVPAQLWAQGARAGLAADWRGAVVGLSFDAVEGRWPVARAVRLPGGEVAVELLALRKSLRGAVESAQAAGGRALVVPAHGLRGQVAVRGLRLEQHLQESDAMSAAVMAPAWLREGLLVHGGGMALTDAVLAVPARRVRRRWDAGTLALVCAWWAGKQRPKAAGA